MPESTPEARYGRAIAPAMLMRGAEFEEGRCPEPTPTPAPTPAPKYFDVKPASEATVYYFDSSRFYHMAADCGSMHGAPRTRSAKRATAKRRAAAAAIRRTRRFWTKRSSSGSTARAART